MSKFNLRFYYCILFQTDDWCFPGCPPKSVGSRSSSRGKLVLVSTLDLVKHGDSLATNLLAEWISGMAGNREVQAEQASVVRVIITGNSISSSPQKKDQDYLVNAADNTEALAQISGAIEKLDSWLDEILGHCSVTLVPGQHDPTNYMLPQKPLHRLILRKSFRFIIFVFIQHSFRLALVFFNIFFDAVLNIGSFKFLRLN